MENLFLLKVKSRIIIQIFRIIMN